MPDRLLFLAGGGETGALIAGRDWSMTPLGPVTGWPQSLMTALGLLLRSPVPMVLLWGEDGVMLYNDAYSVFAGGRHPAQLGMKVREGWPEVADFNDNVMRVGLAGGTLAYRDQELTLYRHERPEQVWMNLDYSPVPDESGKPAGVLAIVIETTERVAAEAALREERDRAHDVLDNMGEAFALLDRDFRITDMNAEALRLEGRPRADVIGRTHWEAHPNAAPEIGDLYRRAMAGRAPVALEHRYVWPTGRVTWIGMRAYPVESGLAVFYRDVTERKMAEEALRESEERLRLAVEAGRLSAWAYDFREGRGVREGPLATSLAVVPPRGFSFEEWMKPIHLEDRPEVERRFQATARGELARFEVEFRVRSLETGNWLWLSSFGEVVERDPVTGEPIRMAGVAADITRRKAAEERQALLSREVDHRAKNALSVVLSALRLTRAPDVASYVRAVEGRVAALARAQTILAEDRWAGADLATLVRGELVAFIGRDDSTARVELCGPRLALPAGAAQPIAMAVHELATNAVKYGALSLPTGMLRIDWHVEDGAPEVMRLRWTERGGPPLEGSPIRRGFGSRVLEGTMRGQLRGDLTLSWNREGLVCEMRIPLERPSARTGGDPAADGASEGIAEFRPADG